MKLIPTPSQTVGPFFAVGLDRAETADLTQGGTARGERIEIEGQVRDGDGAPIPDAMLEIWQANAAGKYAHPDDKQEKPADPNFLGFGRAFADKAGRFRFITVRPGAVPGRGNALQAPHFAITILARGLLKALTTRAYFAGEPLNDSDPLLSSIDDPKRRATLIAEPDGADGWRMDIRLQRGALGDAETVFLDI